MVSGHLTMDPFFSSYYGSSGLQESGGGIGPGHPEAGAGADGAVVRDGGATPQGGVEGDEAASYRPGGDPQDAAHHHSGYSGQAARGQTREVGGSSC